ncbi:UNVERIFIED_CONTAM: hypothetical protein Sangu_0037100 [Sesamum angustifolium]|uniref:Alpha/beta-Hydrolases superfamily protein n=1 Tax=Sesamum angustifolium TaxID=2727405 RepID=A0AAW2RJV4_9LAMI
MGQTNEIQRALTCTNTPLDMDSRNSEMEESISPLMANRNATRDDRPGIPQLFTSVPTLNDAASYLAETTSIFTRCFTDISIRPVSEDANGQEMLSFVSGEARVSTDSRNSSSSASVSSVSESIDTKYDAPVVHGAITRSTAGESSQNSDVFCNQITQTRVAFLSSKGLFSNHGPLYFVNTKTSFLKMGLTCHIAKIHSEASVDKNAKEIKEYIEEIYWGSRKQVLLLGHSKGGVDAAAALSMYWDELKDKVAGLALAQSPYGGSPIASDILREGQLGDYVNIRKLMEILICKVIKRAFSPAVLAHARVAHAELPMFSPLSAGQPTTLPVVIPLGAAMAACAQLLQIRYGEKSDGLVTRRDAEVPGSVVVRPTRKLDHAWMVYSSLDDDPLEANASQVCEALSDLAR